MRSILRGLLLLGALALASCRADITYRLDVKNPNTAVVSIKEVLDPQIYSMVLSQSQNGDVFTAPAPNWEVKRSVDDDGNHVISATSPAMPIDQAVNGFETIWSANKAPVNAAGININPTIANHPFFTTVGIDNTIPAIMNNTDDPSNPYASMGASMATSLIGMHFELRTPGTVTATNGEITPDGYTRWDLNLVGPTHIIYGARIINWTMIIFVGIASVTLLGIIIVLAARSRKPAIIEQSLL